jgi:hypothetical protein
MASGTRTVDCCARGGAAGGRAVNNQRVELEDCS